MITDLQAAIGALECAHAKAAGMAKTDKKARCHFEDVIPAMNAVRAAADTLETLVDAELWPIPTYAEMLFIR